MTCRIFAGLLLCVAGQGCVDQTDGIRVELSLGSHGRDGTQPAAGAPLSLRDDANTLIVLDRAYAVVQSVELIRCPDGALTRLWHALSPISRAYAHTPSTPTRSGTAGVAAAGDARVALATLFPPPGSYCVLDVVVGPTDGHGMAFPVDAELVGRTLRLDGSLRTSGATQWTPLHVESSATRVRRMTLSPPLLLDADARQAVLALNFDYDRWFDRVDVSGLDGARLATRLLETVSDALQVDVDPRASASSSP